MTSEQAAEILRLKAASVGPKQIARKLGLRPAEVTAFIRDNAEKGYLQKAQDKALKPLQECLINRSAFEDLLGKKRSKKGDSGNGLAQIILTYQERNRYLMCSYLIDYWCLGVKDTIPPRRLGLGEYQALKNRCSEQFREPFVDISLEQARSIVYGAVNYARSLGFKPHRDFNGKARAHLGPEPENLVPIEFGKDGQPFFMSGPHDNAQKILRTLETNVGAGNFDFVAGIGGGDGFLGLPG